MCTGADRVFSFYHQLEIYFQGNSKIPLMMRMSKNPLTVRLVKLNSHIFKRDVTVKCVDLESPPQFPCISSSGCSGI